MLTSRTEDEESSEISDSESTDSFSTMVSFCPAKCVCNITLSNQLQVVCRGHFDNDFPIGTLRKDVEVLKITPRCERRGGRSAENDVVVFEDAANVPIDGYGDDADADDNCPHDRRRKNRLSLGPNFQYLRLLKAIYSECKISFDCDTI